MSEDIVRANRLTAITSPERMTIEELRRLLRDRADHRTLDLEQDHIDADNWLLEFINDEEVSKAFNEIEKWYS